MRGLGRVTIATAATLMLATSPTSAQHCDFPFSVVPGARGGDTTGCGLFDVCVRPTVETAVYEVTDTTLGVSVEFEVPGNHQNDPGRRARVAWFGTADPPQFCDSYGCPGALTICGNLGNEWLTDHAETKITLPRPSCEDLDTNPDLGFYSIAVVSCFHDPFGCVRKTDVPDVDLSVGTVGELLGCGQLDLNFAGSCPGQIEITGSGGTPGGTAGIVFSDTAGSDPLAGGPCAGTPTALESPRLLTVVTFDADGDFTLMRNAPPNACGLLTQVVDGETCAISGVASP